MVIQSSTSSHPELKVITGGPCVEGTCNGTIRHGDLVRIRLIRRHSPVSVFITYRVLDQVHPAIATLRTPTANNLHTFAGSAITGNAPILLRLVRNLRMLRKRDTRRRWPRREALRP